jgi:exonuclease III
MDRQSFLVWNVRGLNTNAHRDAVRELVAAERPSIACLQETKLAVITPFYILQLLGHGLDYLYLPTNQTRGGILIAWLMPA